MADLSALLSPVINLIKRLNGGENPSSSQVAAVDRTLGTITTLGLTYAVCKLVANVIEELSNPQLEDSDNGGMKRGAALDGKEEKEEDGKKIIPSFLNLVHVICRGILVSMGATGRESPRRSPSMADFEQSSRNYPSDNGEWRNFHGSCHCKSISFVLNAPAHITAKDCKGKIRYPHLTIESDQFQLTSGTRYLSVYYVRLPDKKHSKKKTKGSTFSWIPSTQTAGFDHHQHNSSSSHQNENIAAHTFCNRCGVHILRAPDSKSNRLEVNVNCFEELYNNINDEEEMNGAVHVETIYKEDEDGRGLGSGVAIAERLKTVVDNDAENESLEHDYSYEGGLVYDTNGNSDDEGEGAEWTSQFAYVEQQHKTVIHTPASTRSTSTMSASTPTASMAATSSSGWNGFKPVVTRQHPGTPTTFDTSVVSASDSVTTTDELNLPTLEGGFSFDHEQQQQQQQQHYFPPPTNDDESDFPSSSSSLPSPSMNSNNTIPGFRTFSTTTASSSLSSSKNSSSNTNDSRRPPIGPPPLSSSSTSAVTREQLKYYMKKHVSPVASGRSNGTSKNMFPTNPGS